MAASPTAPTTDDRCSARRSLEVLSDRWAFLILRQALLGQTRFSEFRAALGIARDVLTQRLAALVEAGVLERRQYQEPGSRARVDYHLTRAGMEIKTILGALQQWGDEHRPHPDGPIVERRSSLSGRRLRVAFVDEAGEVVEIDDADIAASRPEVGTAGTKAPGP